MLLTLDTLVNMSPIFLRFLVYVVTLNSFAVGDKTSQLESCKEVANEPMWVDEFHTTCFNNKEEADAMEKPKG